MPPPSRARSEDAAEDGAVHMSGVAVPSSALASSPTHSGTPPPTSRKVAGHGYARVTQDTHDGSVEVDEGHADVTATVAASASPHGVAPTDVTSPLPIDQEKDALVHTVLVSDADEQQVEERPKLSIGNVLARFIPVRILGVSYLAISAVIFSIQALCVSQLSSRMPSMQIVMFRCILQFGFGWMACASKSIDVLGPRDRRWWLFVRGGVGFLSFSCYYFAMSHLTFADATTLFFTAPLYTPILGYLILGEAVARFDVACTITSIIGVVMIVRPAFMFGANEGGGAEAGDAGDPDVNTGSFHFAGIFAAILGSWLSAGVYIVIRKIGPGVQPLVLVSYMGLVGLFFAPFGGLAQSFVWPADVGTYFVLLLIGVLSFIGQTLFNAGVQLEKAGPASMIRNLDVACSFLWQVTIQGIIPNPWSVVGAIVISAAVVAMGIKKWRAHAPVAVPQIEPRSAGETSLELTELDEPSRTAPDDDSPLHDLVIDEGTDSQDRLQLRPHTAIAAH